MLFHRLPPTESSRTNFRYELIDSSTGQPISTTDRIAPLCYGYLNESCQVLTEARSRVSESWGPLAVAIRWRKVHCRISSLLRPMRRSRLDPRKNVDLGLKASAPFAIHSIRAVSSWAVQSCHSSHLCFEFDGTDGMERLDGQEKTDAAGSAASRTRRTDRVD
jgi:hypothetical protein